MNRRTINEVAVFVLLVTAGVITRVLLSDLPNFAPVAALALFAGYFFRNHLVALAVPLLVMAMSDLFIGAGGYPWPLMLTVYGLLALPVCLRRPMRSFFPLDQRRSRLSHIGYGLGGVFGCGLACSLLFFFGTNFMVWATGSWYEPTWAGLMQCFGQALPFFRYTLAGDAVFAVVFFGGYAAVLRSIAVSQRISVSQPAACGGLPHGG